MPAQLNDIVFDARCLIGPQTGIAKYTEMLLLSLAEGGVKVNAFYFNFLGKHETGHLPKHKNIRYIEIRFFSSRLLSLMNRIGIELPIDLFVRNKTATQPIIYTNYVALPSLRKRTTLLVIYDLSMYDLPQYTDKKNLRYMHRMIPRSIRRSDFVITISEFAKQRILNQFHENILASKIIVTPIPPKSTSQHAPLTISNSLKELVKGDYILYLGTIEPRKNIKNLVRGYSALPQQLRDRYSLILAGGKGWNDKDTLAEISALQKIGCRIIQTGYVSNEDRQALYGNASCFVFPSHYEGFGMPILEAMEYEIPIAVSDIPVFHEVAEDGAVYFNPNDPDDIAMKLAEVLNQSSEAVRSKTSHYHALLTRYSWQANVQMIRDLLR